MHEVLTLNHHFMNKRKVLSLMSFLIFLISCKKNIENTQASEGNIDISVPVIVHGEFYAESSPNGDSSFAEISIDVTKPGSYRIYTDVQNGIYFTDSGYFNQTGKQAIRLRPAGSSKTDGEVAYVVHFNSSTSSFIVSYERAEFNIPMNTWRFIEDDSIIHSGEAGGIYNDILIVGGWENYSDGSKMNINLESSGPPFTGWYSTGWFSNINGFSYSQNNRQKYGTSGGYAQMQFEITKYDIEGNYMWGRFYGTAQRPLSAAEPEVKIYNIRGAFKTTVRF